MDAGRLKFIDGTVKMRTAEAPSVGHEASADDSRAGRDTSNSRPQTVQRNGYRTPGQPRSASRATRPVSATCACQ